MKKIISVLICTCMLLGMFPAITFAADAPSWVSSIGTQPTPGTLIGDYSFVDDSNVPGAYIPNSNSATSYYSTEYTSDGFKITKVKTASSSEIDKGNANVKARINFYDNKTDTDTSDGKLEYYSGFKGVYVVDLTIDADFGTISNSGVFYNFVFGTNSDYTDTANTTVYDNTARLVSQKKFQVLTSNGSGNTAFNDGTAESTFLGGGAESTIRLVIDTGKDDAIGQIATYVYDNGSYTYVGTGEYKGDDIQGLALTAIKRGFSKDSFVTFKNMKLYQVAKYEDPSVKVEKTVSVPTPDPDPDPDLGDDTEITLEEWLKTTGASATPGTLIGDYKFINDSMIPGTSIANNMISTSEYSGEYTDEGFKITRIDVPDTGEEAATTDEKARVPFVANIESDAANRTETYQYGLVGEYIVDLYYKANMIGVPYNNAIRYDWSVGYNEDITSYSAGNAYSNMRFASRDTGNQTLTLYVGTGSTAVTNGGGSRNVTRDKDVVMRLYVDTTEGVIAQYNNTGGTFNFVGYDNTFTGKIFQGIYTTPRLGFQKGSYFTFKGVKIYEVERHYDSALGENDRNAEVMSSLKNDEIFPASLVTEPYAVTEDINLPSGATWTSSNTEIISDKGVINRGYEDETVVLQGKFKTTSSPFITVYKNYTLTVKARDDISKEIISDCDYTTQDDCNTLIYSDKNNTSYESSKGLVVKQTDGADNSVISLAERVLTSDHNTKTYINNLKGVYDFELGVIPSVSNTYDDGGKPVTMEAGYYDATTGDFTTYATVDMYKDIAKYNSNTSSSASVDITNEAVNTFKFRVDTVNNQLWIYANGIKSKTLTYSGNGYVNAFRVSVDENAESTDNIILSNANVVSLFSFDNAEFAEADINACADKVANLTMASVTTNPADAYGKMGELPATIDGYNVEWTSSSDYVDLIEKYAYRSTENQNVVVTAKIYDSADSDVYVTKEFYINIDGTTDPEILLEGSTSKLAAKFITNQNANGLVTDIVLPKLVAGNTVTWLSSDESIITSEGVVKTDKDISEPTTVTLTATVTNGSATVSKNINFTVAKRGADVTLYTSSANIETPITGVVTYEATLNGTATLKDSNGKKIIELNDTGEVKVVMDFNNSKVSVFKDNVLVSDYIDFAEAAENFNSVESSNVSNEKIILDEYALYNYNIEKFGFLDDLRKEFITGDVTLGKTTVGGAVITWDSENTAILTNNGTYDAPEGVMFFDVNFSITLPGGTGATYKETLTVVAIPENNIFAGSTVTNQGVSVPTGAYQTDLMFDGDFADTMFRGSYDKSTKSIVVDMKNKQDINTLYIANDGLKSCDIYVSDDNSQWALVAQPVFDGTNKNNIVEFDRENGRYVKIDNIVYEGDYVDIYEIAGFAVYDSSDKSYMDILNINMPEGYVLTAASITLPSTGAYGSAFVWTSSNPAVIAVNGAITKPLYDTEVILTVTSTNGASSSTKSYRYLIKGIQGGQGGIAAGGGGGGGGTYIGDTSTSAFPEENITVQPQVPGGTKIFNDVNESDWFYKYVLDLKNNNIINGDEQNRFNANNYVTREEFVKMIIIAAGYELVTDGEGFNDVKPSDWFSTYVYTAKANGIVNGISETEFGVNRPISRQDMSVIIDKIINVDADISTNRDNFTDDSIISPYAYESVYTVKALGIISGYETGNFNPHGQLTRAEAAKVISMVMDIIK